MKYIRVITLIIPRVSPIIFHLLAGLKPLLVASLEEVELCSEFAKWNIINPANIANIHPIHMNQLYADRSIEDPSVRNKIDNNNPKPNPAPNKIPLFSWFPFVFL
jgi:hypothetical protein